jgi:NADPH-dependent curcumin reductase CurA
MVSQYNLKPGESYPIRNLALIVGKRLKFQGFIVSDENMGPKYSDDHTKKLSKWISDGTFKVLQDATVGIENGPEGFIGMLSGKNFGKALLQIADLEDDKEVS